MDLLVILEAMAFVLTILAMYLVGKPSRHCFVVFCVSQAIQVVIFYFDERWFLILQMIALIIFNVVNYYRWKKQGVG
jgi:nicotinamide riboside transporter PnuC